MQSSPVDSSSPSSAKNSEQPLAFRVVRGGVWVAASSYWMIGLGFIANLFLTRLLSPEHFGVFALASFFFSVANLRLKFGVGYALAQRSETDAPSLGTHFILDLAAGIGSLLLATLAVPILRGLGYSEDVAWVTLAVGFVCVIDSLTGTAWVLLDKNLHFKQTSLVNAVAFPLAYVPAFWLALNGGGYWSLVAQNVTFAVLLLIGMWWTCRRQLSGVFQLRWRWDRRVAGEFARFGMIVGVGALAGTLFAQFDSFLVGTFVGVATLGFYDRAYRIAQWPKLLLNQIIQRTAFYTLARLQDDRIRLAKTVTMVLWSITTGGGAIALAIFVAAPDLVQLLYGERWMSSAIYVRFLSVYLLLGPLAEIAASFFVAMGNPRRTALVWTLQLIVLILVGVPFTLMFGAIGTCISMGIAQALGLLIAYRQLSQVVTVSMRQVFLVPSLAIVIALASYLGVAWNIDLNVIPLAARIVFKAGFVVILFWAIILMAQPRTSLERLAYVWRLLRRTQSA